MVTLAAAVAPIDAPAVPPGCPRGPQWQVHKFGECAQPGGCTSKGMAGETTAYLVKDMPPAVATALAAYRRVALS